MTYDLRELERKMRKDRIKVSLLAIGIVLAVALVAIMMTRLL